MKRSSDRGQILVLYLILLLPLSLLVFTVFNVGTIVAERMRLQTAADAAAYSAAVWQARYANLVALTNRAIVANYDMIATQVALWSMADAWDGFSAEGRNRLRLEGGGTDLESVHDAFHDWNEAFARRAVGRSNAVGSSLGRRPRPDRDGALRLENYSQVLAEAERALYLVTQTGRHALVEAVARSFDPSYEASTLADGLSSLSLHSRVRWEGSPELRGTIERSMNPFARGESRRDFQGPTARSQKAYLDAGCGPVRITAQGISGPGFGEGAADDPKRILRDDRVRQVDRVRAARESQGSLVGCPSVDLRDLQIGHSSDDAENRLRRTQKWVRHRDDPRLPRHVEHFVDAGLECSDDPDLDGGEPCATEYRWLRALSELPLSTFAPSPAVEDGRELEGPGVLVILRKPGRAVRVLTGVGLVVPDDLEAYAYAKVYYDQEADDGEEPESLFNPHWRARLETFRPFGTPLLH